MTFDEWVKGYASPEQRTLHKIAREAWVASRREALTEAADVWRKLIAPPEYSSEVRDGFDYAADSFRDRILALRDSPQGD